VILTDREIQLAIRKEQISILPIPSLDAYSSTSIDLRLGDRLTIFKDDINSGAIEHVIDPTRNYNAEREIKRLSDELIIGSDGFILHPNKFILGWTLEKVTLPMMARVSARVEGKSSLARLGLLIHFTAPTIHSGFDNLIRLEIMNHGVVPIRLRKEMKICQLIFELTFGTPEKAFTPAQSS
jgi:dCTP deaminase